MNNNYEVVFITRPDVGEDVTKGIIQKATETVENLRGKVVKVDEWGKRKLAYPIRKYSDGYYMLMTISCNPETLREFERILRLNEDVIRFQTVKQIEEKKAPDAVKKESSGQPKEISQ